MGYEIDVVSVAGSGSDVDILTPTSGKKYAIKSVRISNNSGSSATCNLRVKDGGTAVTIESGTIANGNIGELLDKTLFNNDQYNIIVNSTQNVTAIINYIEYDA